VWRMFPSRCCKRFRPPQIRIMCRIVQHNWLSYKPSIKQAFNLLAALPWFVVDVERCRHDVQSIRGQTLVVCRITMLNLHGLEGSCTLRSMNGREHELAHGMVGASQSQLGDKMGISAA